MNRDKPHKYKYHDFGDTRKTKDCWCGLHKEDPLHIMLDKNTRDNRIHKEGFDAGYNMGYKVGYMEGWEDRILTDK